MSHLVPHSARSTRQTDRPIRFPFPKLSILGFLLLVPLAAHAQGSPFDTGFTSLQTIDPYRDCPKTKMRDAQIGVVGAVSIGSFELSR
jgi:hypothetical protein